MVVGVCKIRLIFREARSLKGKRQVLRSIKDKMKNRFNISIAEVDDQDYHQSAMIGLAVAAADAPHADSQIQAAISFIAMEAEIADLSTQIISV